MSDIQNDGIRAQQLLDDDLMQRMFALAEKEVVEALAMMDGAAMADHVALITLVNRLQAARRLPQMLQATVSIAEHAKKPKLNVA